MSATDARRIDGRSTRAVSQRTRGEINPEALRHVADYIDDCERGGLRPSTIKSYRSKLTLIAESQHPTAMVDLERDELEAFLDARSLGPRARYRYISDVHGFFRWAVNEGRATKDPTLRMRRPRITQGLPRPILDDDLVEAIQQAPPDVRAMLLLGAYQGLRCQEIAGLQRDDVLDRQDPPVLIVAEGKGGKQRVLPLHEDVIAALRVMPMPKTGYVFAGASGRAPHPHEVSHRLNHFFDYLNIDATAHQLRHWFGTKVYAESQDLRVTQELLGHSSPTTTTVYVAYSVASARRAVESLGAGRRCESCGERAIRGRCGCDR